MVSAYGKKQIWRSLNTKDYKLAKLRAELETMSIRRKLLNDLNKQKQKEEVAKKLDFSEILYDDDDDELMEEWENQKDTIDFSNYTDDDFLKLDSLYAIENMSLQTYEKYSEIQTKHRMQQKLQKALEKEKADDQIRSSIYD